MDFEIPEKIRIITGMIDEFMDREIIPLEPELLRGSFSDLLPVLSENAKL